MSWNEQDPWKRKNAGPPDLETLIKNLFKPKKDFSLKGQGINPSLLFMIIIAVFCALYLLSGFYIVREPERAVVTRLGKFHRINYSGLNWHPRFIDHIYIIDVEAIDSFKKENAMLTEDENIINAGFEIQYRKENPEDFLFNDQSPIVTLHQLTESAIRDVIGHAKLDEILTSGKQDITNKIKKQIEQGLISYKLGIELKDVNLSFALPPAPVQQAFNDVIKAREDEQAYQNEAERYKESKLPIALGHAQRIMFEADAYSKEKIFKAEAHAKTFTLLEAQYRLNPELMKNRLYYETIDKVMASTRKILIDPELGNHLMYFNALNNHSGEVDQSHSVDKKSSIDESHLAHAPQELLHQSIKINSPLIVTKD
jgi:modulator of FtsH protease HflK